MRKYPPPSEDSDRDRRGVFSHGGTLKNPSDVMWLGHVTFFDSEKCVYDVMWHTYLTFFTRKFMSNVMTFLAQKSKYAVITKFRRLRGWRGVFSHRGGEYFLMEFHWCAIVSNYCPTQHPQNQGFLINIKNTQKKRLFFLWQHGVFEIDYIFCRKIPKSSNKKVFF